MTPIPAEETATKIFALIADIREKRKEQDRLLSQLEVWASLMAQGIDPGTVESFGYRQAMDGRKPPFPAIPRGYHALKVWRELNPCYTYVKLKDGSTLAIDPIPAPRGPFDDSAAAPESPGTAPAADLLGG